MNMQAAGWMMFDKSCSDESRNHPKTTSTKQLGTMTGFKSKQMQAHIEYLSIIKDCEYVNKNTHADYADKQNLLNYEL